MPLQSPRGLEARTVFDRSNTGIMGSNPTGGMDVCLRVTVLCRPV
jgi:hypothetical protein